ncbi:hypothetical protein [Flavobacterium sp. 140616W15]|uniref:hypothetical protein n=1 Tax=Flavobacterium sp. 140616W15 TaxID=2478552 RepID=UPI000F0C7975|nr:hypothetical protein [Flavobacterium sp. 140616W15]AYN03765.1 hypothetical protein EAG11_05920 [Flavobacterium sp. 140616W15]
MKTTNLTILVMVSFIFCNCKDNIEVKPKIEENSKSTLGVYQDYFNDKKKVNSLMDKIVFRGDTLAYKELSMIYALSGHRSDYLRVSLIMANKYQYAQAYYDVYNDLYRTNSYISGNKEETIEDLNLLDKETRNLAIKYLEKSASKGYTKAKKSLLLYNSKGELLENK